MSKYPSHVVPMSSPDLTDAERQAVQAVLSTPNLSMGPYIEKFEQSFCDLTGSKHAIAVNSGTAGLHLCVRAAGWGPGDLVLTTSFSFVASTNVILFEGATPVFTDVEPQGGNIDPDLVEQAVKDLMQGGTAAKRWLPRKGVPAEMRLKGLLAVDVFGQPAELGKLRQIADRYGLAFIEDSCEALGAEYKGQAAGTFGDSGVFAFYPNKQITVGEGGLIITNDDRSANLMRALRNQGRAPGDTWLSHTYLGYNYRLDEMSAAMGAVQMSRLQELIAKRQQVADWYAAGLKDLPFEIPYVAPYTSKVSWFVYVIRIPKGMDRSKVAENLAMQGIPVRPYFLPIHLQPYMVEQYGYQAGDLPVTEDLGERGLALPFSGVMTHEQVDLVCAALKKVL
ncbi:MAG: DegT/DnrJ/EryC1/StrS family aminotransferase [Anaerolineaceae bacterium]|nr:DegT/DnrJ/EryC1/StrS family aminotransferase [Anaerolineaceae bacterium]